jgi:hypothetical protein
MRVETRTIRGIGSGEGCHRDSVWISLPLEELIKIGILEHPQHYRHAVTL